MYTDKSRLNLRIHSTMAQYDLSQYDPLVVRHHVNYAGRCNYYSYNNELYAPTFPEAWAKDHLPGTGPECCAECKTFGFWNGVFLGYCVKCSDQYHGDRGNGFIFYGEEKKSAAYLENAAFNSYLRDVDFSEIGDVDFMDTAAIIEELNAFDPYDIECGIKRKPKKNSAIKFVKNIHIQYLDDVVEDDDEEGDSYSLEEVEWFEDRIGCGYGSNYDGGYDSY